MSDDDSSSVMEMIDISMSDVRDALLGTGQMTIATLVKRGIQQSTVSVFRKHGAEDLERYILVDYNLVQEEMPPNIKKVVRNYGPQYADAIVAYVNPNAVLHWLENPNWIPEEEEEVRQELQECADVIRETPGGREWLNRQVFHIYQMAGIANEAPR